MQIRTRLTIRFSLTVTLILTVFSLAIYYNFSSYREDKFYESLKTRALTETSLYVNDNDGVDSAMLNIIDKNRINAKKIHIAIYDESGTVVYKYPATFYAPVLSKDLRSNVKSKDVRHKENGIQSIWIYCGSKQGNTYVFVSSTDDTGYKRMDFLAEMLMIGCLITFFITSFTGYFFTERMLSPINNIIDRVKEITSSNLDLRLQVGRNNDEIDKLSSTFNNMLVRLEDAFQMNRDFISNASHELRTPLGVLMVQIEVALLSNRTPDEYKQVLASMLDDIKNLKLLMNGLLEISEANTLLESVNLSATSAIELLWEAKEELLIQHPNYKITESFKIISSESKASSPNGNRLLLRAFYNIMDNGCKYSPNNEVNISLEIAENILTITFTDSGIGISEKDLAKVFQPFFRGTNAKTYSGNGLGLALTKKIIELHNGQIHIDTELNRYTKVMISLSI